MYLYEVFCISILEEVLQILDRVLRWDSNLNAVFDHVHCLWHLLRQCSEYISIFFMLKPFLHQYSTNALLSGFARSHRSNRHWRFLLLFSRGKNGTKGQLGRSSIHRMIERSPQEFVFEKTTAPECLMWNYWKCCCMLGSFFFSLQLLGKLLVTLEPSGFFKSP